MLFFVKTTQIQKHQTTNLFFTAHKTHTLTQTRSEMGELCRRLLFPPFNPHTQKLSCCFRTLKRYAITIRWYASLARLYATFAHSLTQRPRAGAVVVQKKWKSLLFLLLGLQYFYYNFTLAPTHTHTYIHRQFGAQRRSRLHTVVESLGRARQENKIVVVGGNAMIENHHPPVAASPAIR